MSSPNGTFPQVECVGPHPVNKAVGVAIPVMVVPIIYRLAKYPQRVLHWPQPLYLQYKGPLCAAHARAFTMRDYNDYCGGPGWYEMVGDHLRSHKKPAKNPFPNDPTFEWEEWIINPNWEPAPVEECKLQLWDVKTLYARGMSQRLW